LILASGIPQHWLRDRATISFGPAPTSFGVVSISMESQREKIVISWKGAWQGEPPSIEVRVPGSDPVFARSGQDAIELTI
jgi:hypothetical protein